MLTWLWVKWDRNGDTQGYAMLALFGTKGVALQATSLTLALNKLHRGNYHLEASTGLSGCLKPLSKPDPGQKFQN